MEKIRIIQDTREQKPWPFPAEEFEVTVAKLSAGDYSIAGLEDEFAIERKSLGDLVGTLIGGWIRFRKELNRLAGYRFAAIVVEADISDVHDHRYESETKPASVLGRINSIMIDYAIPTMFLGHRDKCAPAVAQLITHYYRENIQWATPLKNSTTR